MKYKNLNFLIALVLFFHFSNPFPASFVQIGTAPADFRIIASSSNRLVAELLVPDFKIHELDKDGVSTQTIFVPGLNMSSEPGEMQLPVYSFLVAVPPSGSYELIILADEAVQVKGIDNLAVTQSPQPVDEAFSTERLWQTVFPERETQGILPESAAVVAGEAWLRDQRLARIVLQPFQVDAIAHALLWHQRLLVEIRFIPDALLPAVIAPPPEISTLLQDLLSSQVVNPDVSAQWRGMSGSLPVGSLDHFVDVDGSRYQITVVEDGLYRLSYADLDAAGMDMDQVDPRTFALTSQDHSVAIYVAGETDGRFDPEDYVLFYGEEFRGERMAGWYPAENAHWLAYLRHLPDGSAEYWQPEFNATMMEKYPSQNVYWLQEGGMPGPRMPEIDGDPGGSPAPYSLFDQHTIRADPSNRRWEFHFTNEETWFWEWIASGSIVTKTYTTTLTTLASDAYTATVRGEVVGYNYNDTVNPDHHTQVRLNSQSTPIDDAFWDGKSRYHFEALFPQSDLREGSNDLLFTTFSYANLTPSIWFDWFEIDYARRYQAQSDQFSFSGDIAGEWKYAVGAFSTADIQILDVTQPFTPTRVLSPMITGNGPYTVTFAVEHAAGDQYLLAGSQVLRTPDSISFYMPPELKSPLIGADYLVIAPSDFITDVQRLADYRGSQGMRTLVVDFSDVVNEFNEGIYHPIAIKNLLRYAFQSWQPPAPAFVVLVGDGHWNIRGFNPPRYGTSPIYLPPNLGWVDPWQGEMDAANLLANVVGADPLPDVAIGRIPVNSTAELNSAIDKIIAYESGPIQDWQRNLLFVADDTPDEAGDFPASAEFIIADTLEPGYSALRIYEDDYIDNGLCGLPPYPGGPSCPAVNAAITQTFSVPGSLIATFLGHGSIQRWSHEQVLLYHPDDPANPYDRLWDDIGSLQNGDQLPFVFSLTCLDGYWFHPLLQPSLAEKFLLSPGRGAVGSFSPVGLGVSTGHDSLAQGFFSAIFDSGNWNIGAASIAAKTALYNSGGNYDLLHTFTVFGDPALRLRNAYNFELQPETESKAGLPGTSVAYSLAVTNTSILTDAFSIQVSGNTWTTTVPAAVGPLAAGAVGSFDVTVEVPGDLPYGQADNVTISVSSQGDLSQVHSSQLTTTIGEVYGVELIPSESTLTGEAGSVVTHTLELLNQGNITDTYRITSTGSAWEITLPVTRVQVLPAEGIQLPFEVRIPTGASHGDDDSALIQVISEVRPEISDNATLLTVVIEWIRNWLPVISK